LGTVKRYSPAFVVLTDAAEVNGGPTNGSADFSPRRIRNVTSGVKGAPVDPPDAAKDVGDRQQRAKHDLLSAR
jgi:hypothetical protein